MNTFQPTAGQHIVWTTVDGPVTARVTAYTNRFVKTWTLTNAAGHEETHTGWLPQARPATDAETATFTTALQAVTR